MMNLSPQNNSLSIENNCPALSMNCTMSLYSEIASIFNVIDSVTTALAKDSSIPVIDQLDPPKDYETFTHRNKMSVYSSISQKNVIIKQVLERMALRMQAVVYLQIEQELKNI